MNITYLTFLSIVAERFFGVTEELGAEKKGWCGQKSVGDLHDMWG